MTQAFINNRLLAAFCPDNRAPFWWDEQSGWLSYATAAAEITALQQHYTKPRQLIYFPFANSRAHVLQYLAALGTGQVLMLADPAWSVSQHQQNCIRFAVDAWVDDTGQLQYGCYGCDRELPDKAGAEQDASHNQSLASADIVAGSTQQNVAKQACDGQAQTHAPLHPQLTLLLPTSGSTGSHKWVRLSAANITSNAEAIAAYLTLTAADRAITSLPFFYAYGLSVLHSQLIAGGAMVHCRATMLQPAFWQCMRQHNVSHLAGVPFSFQMMLRAGFERADYPALRVLTQAGGRLVPELVRHFATEALQLQQRFFVMYGQTEAAPRMAWLAEHEAVDYPDAIGRALAGGVFILRAPGAADHEVDDVADDLSRGELVYRGPNVMMGYANDRGMLARGDDCSELLTGDLARRDGQGRYYLCGRISRFIKLYGRRINLVDVEAFLHREGHTSACLANDELLEVALESPAVLAQVQKSLCRWLSLPPGAVRLHQLTALPRTASMKVDYPALTRQLSRSAP